MAELLDAVDFALAAYRDDGVWQVREFAHDLVADVDTLAHALRRFPSDAGAVGLVALDEDFLLILRVTESGTRVLLSDVTAADDWDLAVSVLEFLRLPLPDDDADQVPAGDPGLLADLGLSELDLEALLDDADLYPDEMLSEVARGIGCGELFDDVVGLTSA